MKLQNFLLSSLFVFSCLMSASDNHGVYYSELKAFKAHPDSKIIFDKDANAFLGMIQRDMSIFKNTTFFQRFLQTLCFGSHVVIVTRENMPRLYEYIENISGLANIAMPAVFLTQREGYVNAAAVKVLRGAGIVIIDQKLLKELSDEGVEGAIAHELGHIKYNHGNKKALLNLIDSISFYSLMAYFSGAGDVMFFNLENLYFSVVGFEMSGMPYIFIPGGISVKSIAFYASAPRWWIKYFGISAACIVGKLIENKRFEKQADEFTYKVAGRGAGLIEFCECLKSREQQRDHEFAATYNMIKQNKSLLLKFYYIGFLLYYFGVKAVDVKDKIFNYVYYHTFFGPHPTHQSRIDTIKKYLAEQQA